VLRRNAIALAACLCLAVPQAAWSDSDPASHFLVAQNVFFPYQQEISDDLKADLRGATAAAKKAGYPIKVAIIATPADLGGVAQFFDHPTRYAGYLGPEIGFNRKTQPLLVVMPAGLGTYQAGPKAASAIADIEVEEGGDGLARAALEGVSALAEASGNPIEGFEPDEGLGSTSAVVFAIPVALLVLVLAVMSYRRAGQEDEEEEEEAAASA